MRELDGFRPAVLGSRKEIVWMSDNDLGEVADVRGGGPEGDSRVGGAKEFPRRPAISARSWVPTALRVKLGGRALPVNGRVSLAVRKVVLPNW